MELEIGEYVRTKEGYIAKFINAYYDGELYYFDDYIDINSSGRPEKCIEHKKTLREKVTKHSKNIIDLIEAGDFVNGYYCLKVNDEMCNFDLNVMEWTPLKHIDIWENILTHEQYENNCYGVVE